MNPLKTFLVCLLFLSPLFTSAHDHVLNEDKIRIMLAAEAGGGDGVGNAGDGIRQLFFRAKEEAANSLKKINYCSFPKLVSPVTKDWIIANRTRLIEEVLFSKHYWTTKSLDGHCAHTGDTSKSSMLFSIPDCKKSSYNVSTAAELLLHEVVHHFEEINEINRDHEEFADEVGYAIMQSVPRKDCHEVDPFSEQSCQGSADFRYKSFTPTLAASSEIAEISTGKYRLFSRSRNCDNSGCRSWKKDTSRFKTFVTEKNERITFQLEGELRFSFEGPDRLLTVRTIGARKCKVAQKLCVAGIDHPPYGDLFEEVDGQKQILNFALTYNTHCFRQEANLKFDKSEDRWLEIQHVIFGPY